MLVMWHVRLALCTLLFLAKVKQVLFMLKSSTCFILWNSCQRGQTAKESRPTYVLFKLPYLQAPLCKILFFHFRWQTLLLEITIQMKKTGLVVNTWEQDLFLAENTQNVENYPIKPFLATRTDEAKLNTTVAALWSTGMSFLFVV